MSGRYGYRGGGVSRRGSTRGRSGPFEMTRRDRDHDDDEDLYGSMRDAYSYLHGSRDAARDSASRREGVFGDARDLLGLAAGGAIVGLTAGLLGNANIGNTGIPLALIPAGVGYAASYFDILPSFSKDFQNAATGALVTGLGLWALAQGVRVQTARQGQGVVVAGNPPAYAAPQGPFAQMAGVPGMPQQASIGHDPRYAPPSSHLPAPSFNASMGSRSPLSEAEMISIAQRY